MVYPVFLFRSCRPFQAHGSGTPPAEKPVKRLVVDLRSGNLVGSLRRRAVNESVRINQASLRQERRVFSRNEPNTGNSGSVVHQEIPVHYGRVTRSEIEKGRIPPGRLHRGSSAGGRSYMGNRQGIRIQDFRKPLSGRGIVVMEHDVFRALYERRFNL